MSLYLLTHVNEYTGPGVLEVLLAQGHTVLCHDRRFADATARQAFVARSPGLRALAAQTPDALHAEVQALEAETGPLDGCIFNDVHPNTPQPIEAIALDTLQASLDALLLFPFRLSQCFLPGMKTRRCGAMVFITSARILQPEPGFALATTVRAATTAFAQALAREAAPFEIAVNVVAPNYLYSEMYYPRARFVDDPAGRAEIAAKVPLGRLGEPAEVGELVAFLVSGRSRFTTGQVVYFTGGWP